jgi:hypothetical protein
MNHISMVKKNYCLEDSDGSMIMRMKGIPMNTIDKAGNKVNLVNKEFYERIYNREVIVSKFCTLTKNLFGTTAIRSNKMTRTTKALMTLSEWN